MSLLLLITKGKVLMTTARATYSWILDENGKDDQDQLSSQDILLIMQSKGSSERVSGRERE